MFYGTPGFFMDLTMVQWAKQNLKNLKAVDIGPGIHWLREDNPHLIGSELANWYQGV